MMIKETLHPHAVIVTLIFFPGFSISAEKQTASSRLARLRVVQSVVVVD